MNYTPQEKQAQKLWAGYESQNEERFWEEYTPLLKEASTASPSTQEAQQKAQVATKAQKPKMYGGSPKNYPFRATLASLTFVVGLAEIFQANAQATTIWFLMSALFLIVPTNYRYFFSITPLQLTVHNALGNDKIPWATIDNITMQEEKITIDEQGNAVTGYYLLINTKHRVFKYKYNLLGYDHEMFFEHLRRYIANVTEKKVDS